jgi:transposase-like protein
MRWTSRRKAEVVDACRSGERSLLAVLAEYQISQEEFAEWVRLYERGGRNALRSTKLQRYRSQERGKNPLRRRPGK